MPWYRKGDGELKAGEKELQDVEFKPEKLKEDIETSMKTHLDAYNAAQEEKLKPVLDMAATIMEERRAKAERDRLANENKNREENKVESEDYLLDPVDAVRKQIEPTNRAVMVMAARMAKQDALQDKEYYHGDIKAKVDAMLAQQNLAAQSRADVIENCYKLVCYDHQKEIADGKIKARNSAAVFEGGSTGGHGGKETKEGDEPLTAEEKFVAAKMGISDKEWAASKRELSYV